MSVDEVITEELVRKQWNLPPVWRSMLVEPRPNLTGDQFNTLVFPSRTRLAALLGIQNFDRASADDNAALYSALLHCEYAPYLAYAPVDIVSLIWQDVPLKMLS